MKRILALFVLLLCALPLAAHAGNAWVKEGPLLFKKNRAAAVTGSLDSTYVYGKVGNASDTTQAIPIAQLPLPVRNEVTSADSAAWFAFYVGGASTAPAADSIYVGMQASLDGISWSAVTPMQTFYAASTIPSVASAILIELVSSNQFGYLIKCIGVDGDLSGAVLQGATAPNTRQLFGFNYVRFIVCWSAVDAGSAFSAWIGHWQD